MSRAGVNKLADGPQRTRRITKPLQGGHVRDPGGATGKALLLRLPQAWPGSNILWKRNLKDIYVAHTTNSLLNSLACIDRLGREQTQRMWNWEGGVREGES